MNPCDSNSLCLECGLCCNGVIFADVQLEPEDDARRLRSLGLKFAANRKSQIVNHKFAQPCAAFAELAGSGAGAGAVPASISAMFSGNSARGGFSSFKSAYSRLAGCRRCGWRARLHPFDATGKRE